MKKIWNWINKHYIIIILVCIVLVWIFVDLYIDRAYKNGYNDCLQKLKDKYSSPVEKNVIDTFYITRDSIIERTKYIKIIQHDTIEKVYNLNADSTLDLFYKLVSE